jgi:hypothetical protein
MTYSPQAPEEIGCILLLPLLAALGWGVVQACGYAAKWIAYGWVGAWPQ